MNDNFSQRLRTAMERAHVGGTDLAKRTGHKPSAISRWLGGASADVPNATKLASALNVSVHWLLTGEGEVERMARDLTTTLTQALGPPGPRLESSVVREESPKQGDVMARPPGAAPVFWVPIVSWTHAGAATAYEEIPKNWQEMIPTVCKSPSSFGLIIEGDSMTPRCEAGDVVIVMPKEEPRNGCLVVAKLADDGIVLRRFTRMGNLIRLTAYNPVYPTTDYAPESFHWIYPVHSTVRREWS